MFGWDVVFFFMSISVDKLNANLLGEGQLDLLAGWFTKTIGTFGNRDRGLFNCWDLDALVFDDVFTGYNWERDWFVNTGLLWFWVDNGHWWFYNWDRWYVVLGCLGNFVTVLVTISSISTTMMSAISSVCRCLRCTDGDH